MAVVDQAVSIGELIFEERAENLSQIDLERWTVLTDAEAAIVQKLVGPGAKLLSGPRGSGKSTLLRIAYFEAMKRNVAFSVYVNYAKALAIEPLFHTHADAAVIFRQWVLAKIVVALRDASRLWSVALRSDESDLLIKSELYIRGLESGGAVPESPMLSPTRVSEILRSIAQRAGVNRTVLLLDDAAHAFSVKQQREFFEIFRELRSRDIAGKAAIYPGVTSFSPTFQVGHEAEIIEAWFRPDNPDYLATMRQMVSIRFPQFSPRDPSIVDALALASFGLPRGFLNLCYDFHESAAARSNARTALVDSINAHAEVVRTVFSNIAVRLPRFQHFIEVGQDLDAALLRSLKEYNSSKVRERKAGTVAISEPMGISLERVVRFMEYAGIVRRGDGVLSKGTKGSYKRFLVNYSLLIGANSLALGKSYSVGDIVAALQKPNAHALVRARAETLLGAGFDSRCALALPPCPNCSVERINEEQRFCMNCGQELKAASVYKDLLDTDIDSLPLPRRKRVALKEQGFNTVRKLLSDENQSFRRPGSSIGPVWAKRIVTAAEEWVSV
ncbi:AAA family ATPase [Stenotrophomonas forensis]|uniref:AAA family ATPase n=1 Tax=Stenotrophomonas forensis TaxID=2871169 RepID=UPI0039C5C9BE